MGTTIRLFTSMKEALEWYEMCRGRPDISCEPPKPEAVLHEGTIYKDGASMEITLTTLD